MPARLFGSFERVRGALTALRAQNCRFACGGADDGLCRMTAGAVRGQAWRLALSGLVCA